jgi:adenosylcobinamide-GDP ribazoletransferase
MKGLIIALQFLTKIPIRPRLKIESEDLGKSMLWFPLIGLIIGGILVLVNVIASKFFSPLLLNILILLILIWITGAIHLDGFVDTVDGFSGGRTKEEVLRIMRDSSAGVIGIIGLICLLLLKLGLLQELKGNFKNQVLLLMPVMGRWSLVLTSFFSPYARKEDGLGKPFTEYVKLKEFAIATLLALIIGIIFLKFTCLILLSSIFVVTFLAGRFFLRKIGGVTGDTLGAVNEIAEITCLFILLGVKSCQVI